MAGGAGGEPGVRVARGGAAGVGDEVGPAGAAIGRTLDPVARDRGAAVAGRRGPAEVDRGAPARRGREAGRGAGLGVVATTKTPERAYKRCRSPLAPLVPLPDSGPEPLKVLFGAPSLGAVPPRALEKPKVIFSVPSLLLPVHTLVELVAVKVFPNSSLRVASSPQSPS